MAFTLVNEYHYQDDSGSIAATHGISISAGDLVVLYFSVNGSHTITPSQTWDGSLLETPSGETGMQGMYWKIEGSSAPATYTLGLSTVEQFGCWVKVFSATDDIVIDSALVSGYNTTSSTKLVTTAANGRTIANDAVSVIGAGKDNRSATNDPYTVVDNSYVNPIGVNGPEQITGGAHRIYTTGGTGTNVTIEPADGSDSKNDKTFSIHGSWVESGSGPTDTLVSGTLAMMGCGK